MPPRRASRNAVPVGTPNVIVDFEYEGGLLFVTVQNIGDAPAHGISVKFDKKLVGAGGRRAINSMKLFRDLSFLPPGKKIRTFVDTFHSFVTRGQPQTVRTEVSFQGDGQARRVNRARHNLSIYTEVHEVT